MGFNLWGCVLFPSLEGSFLMFFLLTSPALLSLVLALWSLRSSKKTSKPSDSEAWKFQFQHSDTPTWGDKSSRSFSSSAAACRWTSVLQVRGQAASQYRDFAATLWCCSNSPILRSWRHPKLCLYGVRPRRRFITFSIRESSHGRITISRLKSFINTVTIRTRQSRERPLLF